MKNRKGVIAYLLIAFGMAWILWEGILQLGTTLNPIVKAVVMVPTAFAPAIAAFVVRKWITREGFADAGLRLNLRKWRYYLVAWLLPLLILGCIVVLAPLVKAVCAWHSFLGAAGISSILLSLSLADHRLLAYDGNSPSRWCCSEKSSASAVICNCGSSPTGLS